MYDFLYRNIANDRKYIVLRRYSDGHYCWKQYIKTGTGKNYTGCTLKQNRRGGVWHRISKRWAESVLEDYNLLGLIGFRKEVVR